MHTCTCTCLITHFLLFSSGDKVQLCGNGPSITVQKKVNVVFPSFLWNRKQKHSQIENNDILKLINVVAMVTILNY